MFLLFTVCGIRFIKLLNLENFGLDSQHKCLCIMGMKLIKLPKSTTRMQNEMLSSVSI